MIIAAVPVHRERVPLPVERAEVRVVVIAHHFEVDAEVDVGGQFGVKSVLALDHEVAECIPFVCRPDFVSILFGDADSHLLVARDGGVFVEVVGKGVGVIMVLVVAAAHDVSRGGQADGLAAVGIAGGFHLVLVGEVHLIYFLCRVVEGDELRLVVRADGLSPHLLVSALLQLISHLAVLELVCGYLRALCLAAGVEVVAVVRRGVISKGIGSFSVVFHIVRAGVEAVGQRAGAVLAIYESAHASSACTAGIDTALDKAVGDGNAGAAIYIGNQASRSAPLAGIGTCDVHIADAARDGVVIAGYLVNQPCQKVTARFDSPCGAQVLDGCAAHPAEGGDVVFVGVPVERERMVLSVERTGILMIVSSHHRDVRAEVDVGFETGIEISHALVVDQMSEYLPFVEVFDEHGISPLVRAYYCECLPKRRLRVKVVLPLIHGNGYSASGTFKEASSYRFLNRQHVGISAFDVKPVITPVVRYTTFRRKVRIII